jgi:ATP-dependent DNA helicase RecQ
VIDVLLGRTTDKVAQHRHDRLSVFGIGRELDARGWRSLVRQLVVRGYVRVDAQYGALVLTEASRPLLRGEATLALREDGPSRPPAPKTQAKPAALRDEDRELWEALRACRRDLAAARSVPPYVIFHDRTLLYMVERRPRAPGELLEIPGVGQAKLERYGEPFLVVLRAAP